MKRIFVTGAGGFVGARACQYLQQTGWDVHTLPGGMAAHCTETELQEKLAAIHPEVILHTAAISDTGYAEQYPEEAYRANVELPVWIAHSADKMGAKLLCFSSDQVYAVCRKLALCRKQHRFHLPMSMAGRSWRWNRAC